MTTMSLDRISRQDLELPYPFRGPSNSLESDVCLAFASVLRIDEVGGDDEFFDLGGDSLSVEAVALEIATRTGKEIKVSWLASHGTPAGIADLLSDEAPAEVAPGKVPVFAVHGRFGFMLPRPEVLDGLAPGQEMHMFELPGLRNDEETPKWLGDIAAGYVRELNEAFPEGPVYLTGICAGSLIALEMACQLKEQGRHIEQLVLGDPNLPRGTAKAMGVLPSGSRNGPRGSLIARVKWTLRRAVMSLAVGRSTDGTDDRDFSDERLRSLREFYFRLRLLDENLLLALKKQKKWIQRRSMSMRAQARLYAAYRHYRPRRYEGPVSVVVSESRKDFIPAWEELFPNGDIQMVGVNHSDAVSVAARLFGERAGWAGGRLGPASGARREGNALVEEGSGAGAPVAEGLN